MFDGHPLFYEWTRDYVKVFELNRPNGGTLAAIHHLFGGPTSANPNIVQDNPMDMEFGADGASTRSSTATGSSRRTRRRNCRGSTSFATASTRQSSGVGHADLLDDAAADRPVLERRHGGSDGDPIAYAWDFDADGTVDSRQANPTFTYTQRGIFEATLRVTDTSGRSASNSVQIIIGNQRPRVQLTVWMCPDTGLHAAADPGAAVPLRGQGALRGHGH